MIPELNVNANNSHLIDLILETRVNWWHAGKKGQPRPKNKSQPEGWLLRPALRDYLARLRTKSTNFSMSASATRGEYGGIGTPPVTSVQLPLPPFFTFSTKRALAPASPLYLLETSCLAGPTTFFSTEWQAKQPLFFANSKPSSAFACVVVCVFFAVVVLFFLCAFFSFF